MKLRRVVRSRDMLSSDSISKTRGNCHVARCMLLIEIVQVIIARCIYVLKRLYRSASTLHLYLYLFYIKHTYFVALLITHDNAYVAKCCSCSNLCCFLFLQYVFVYLLVKVILLYLVLTFYINKFQHFSISIFQILKF